MNTYNEPKPWTRLDNETTLSFNAFTIYRDLGPTRSYSKVVEVLNHNSNYIRQVQLWSSKYKWVKRVTLYDDWMDEKKLELAHQNLHELYNYTFQRSKEVIDMLVDINLGKRLVAGNQLKSIELYFKAIGLVSNIKHGK